MLCVCVLCDDINWADCESFSLLSPLRCSFLQKVAKWSSGFRLKPTIWLKRRAHQDSNACSCCFDRIQQPLNHVALERVLATNAFAARLTTGLGCKREFPLAKDLGRLLRTVPHRSATVRTRFDHGPDELQLVFPHNTLVSQSQCFTSVATELLQWVLSKPTSNPASSNFTQQSSIMASIVSETAEGHFIACPREGVSLPTRPLTAQDFVCHNHKH